MPLNAVFCPSARKTKPFGLRSRFSWGAAYLFAAELAEPPSGAGAPAGRFLSWNRFWSSSRGLPARVVRLQWAVGGMRGAWCFQPLRAAAEFRVGLFALATE